jgi:hypothetical protein
VATQQNPKMASSAAKPSAAREVPIPETLVSRACNGLQYHSGVSDIDGKPLPQWCRFLVETGATVSYNAEPRKRIVASFSLPTRAFAAVFLSLGAILARLSSALEAVADAAHIQSLCALAKGTPVTLCHGDRRMKGLFLGCQEDNGQLRARVQLESTKSGGLERWIPQAEWARIQVTSKTTVKLPDHQTGRLSERGEILDAMLGASEALKYTLGSQLECVLVGRANMLQNEIDHAPFSFRASDSCCNPGSLQEILRVRRFLGEGFGFRSDVIPVDGTTSATSQTGMVPGLAVLDGSRSYLKWRHLWPDTHTIVVLDRTEIAFDEAVQMLNQDFAQKRVGDEWSAQKLPPIPAGIEVMIYEEARR